MSLIEFKSKKNDDILRSMIDYMNFEDEDDDDFDCGYTQEEIDRCAEILDAYIDQLETCKNDEKAIMKYVKNVILQLNVLNKACSSLIETDQREYLCSFIEEAAVVAGLPQPDDDITEEWREW